MVELSLAPSCHGELGELDQLVVRSELRHRLRCYLPASMSGAACVAAAPVLHREAGPEAEHATLSVLHETSYRYELPVERSSNGR